MAQVHLREWSTAEPEEGSALAGLRLDDAGARAVAARLRATGRLAVEELAAGLRVSSRSFVGRVQLGSLVVTIEPKLATGPLLALVRYAYGLRDIQREGTASFATTGTLLPDLLAAQLLGEVTELVSRGVPRRYVERAEELGTPRGRIDVAALARRGVPAATLPCRHHPRSADHPLLQVLRAGLGLAAEITADRELRLALRRLGARLAVEVSSIELTRTVVARVRRGLTRLESAAEASLELVELLLDGQAVTLEDATTVRLPGFLFDMNRFFQALVGRWLREHLPGCRVIDERGLSELLAYAPDWNPQNRRAPQPRPDFAVRAPGRPIVLLDAKYRDLWAKPLPREMLYQLAMYATSGAGDPLAVILHPVADPLALEARIDIRDVVTGAGRGGVALRPVPLERLAHLVREGSREARESEAARLAFGT